MSDFGSDSVADFGFGCRGLGDGSEPDFGSGFGLESLWNWNFRF